jgi:hypothetical protein
MNSTIFINFNNYDKNADLIINLLRQYDELITSSIGPLRSNTKFISGKINTENLVITNSSRFISQILYKLEHLNLDQQVIKRDCGILKWQFDLLRSVIDASHASHFYDSGLLLCHLITQFLIQIIRDNLNPRIYSNQLLNKNSSEFKFRSKNLIEYLFNDLKKNLSESKTCPNSLICIKSNLTNLNFLKKLICTIFNSKSIFEQLTSKNKHVFIVQCLRAFIKSFQTSDDYESQAYFSKILYLFNENFSLDLSDSELYDGVLFKLDKYQLEESFQNMISNFRKLDANKRILKCIIFDSNSLSGDFETLEGTGFTYQIDSALSFVDNTNFRTVQVDNLKAICHNLISKHSIDVVMCQKVRDVIRKCD